MLYYHTHFVRVEICAGHNVRDVRRLRYVLVVTQYVHGVLARRHRVVPHVGWAVSVVLAVDFSLRRSFDTETCVCYIVIETPYDSKQNKRTRRVRRTYKTHSHEVLYILIYVSLVSIIKTIILIIFPLLTRLKMTIFNYFIKYKRKSHWKKYSLIVLVNTRDVAMHIKPLGTQCMYTIFFFFFL